MRLRRFSLALGVLGALLLSLARPAASGGPLTVTNGGTPVPIIWRELVSPFGPAASIPYNMDRGKLGKLTEAEAQAIVAELFGVWDGLDSASVSYTHNGAMPVDVNGSNYLTYLGSGAGAGDGRNPIVFDEDGAIHDALFGANNSVLGFAGFVTYYPSIGGIAEGQACLNGRWIDGNTANGEVADVDVFKGTFLHEFGHYSGLDHAQINNAEAWDADPDNDRAVPTMYPVNIFQAGSSTERLTPNPDDVQALSNLYPSAEFSSTHGKITGTVFSASGVSTQGVNVVARSIDNPTVTACSCVSGYMFQKVTDGTPSGSFGTTNTLYRGSFEIAVPAGRYTVEIEPIDQRFNGGSSVGPITPPIHAGPREYWNGYFERETYAYDHPGEATVIPVTAGKTVSSINFFLNRAAGMSEIFGGPNFDLSNKQLIFTPDWSAAGGYRVQTVTGVANFPINPGGHAVLTLEDNSFVTIGSPLGLFIPFYGEPYVSYTVSANGLITFGATGAAEIDSTPTEPEFFATNPKIAPFWADLDPSSRSGSGSVSVAHFSNGLCVTFERVAVRGQSGSVSFQVFIERNTGIVTITYLDCTSESLLLAGLSSGGSYVSDPTLKRDFSTLGNDTTAPTVTITAPDDRKTVSGTAVTFSATTSDPSPSSGTPVITYYIDGIYAAEGVGSYAWDTTKYSNGEHRLSVISRDGAGNISERAIVVNVQNAGGIAISQRLHSYAYTAPALTCQLEIKNDSTQTLTNVRVNQIYLEVTGSFSGMKRAYGSPTSGAVFPDQVAASLAPGQSVTIPLVFAIPSGGTSVFRWVNEGFCDQLQHF